MYNIYQITFCDYMDEEETISFRGPLQPSNNDSLAVLNLLVSEIEQVINGYVCRKSYGIEEIVIPATIDQMSTVKLRLQCGYTDGNGTEKTIFIPSPNVGLIDFQNGDIVKLNKQPIKSMLDTIEDETLDLANGTSLSFDYVVLVGKE